MDVLLSLAFAIVLAVCVFFWLVSTYIDLGVCIIRCFGRSSTSTVPGVATVTGLIGAAIIREWFQWVESPIVYFVAAAPDAVYQCGELVLLIRIRIFGWPDKAQRPT